MTSDGILDLPVKNPGNEDEIIINVLEFAMLRLVRPWLQVIRLILVLTNMCRTLKSTSSFPVNSSGNLAINKAYLLIFPAGLIGQLAADNFSNVPGDL